MLCDVSMRWDSTHDMLMFAVEHKKQLSELTSDLKNNLWAYELLQEEWWLAEELGDTLKVNKQLILTQCHTCSLATDLERCYQIFLLRIP